MRRRLFRFSTLRVRAPLAAARNPYRFTPEEHDAWLAAACALVRFTTENP